MKNPTSKPLYTAKKSREIERFAATNLGLDGYELMCRAGAAALSALRLKWPQARRIAIVSGPGNNGGDGFVLARLAKEAGIKPAVCFIGKPEDLKGEALEAYKALGADTSDLDNDIYRALATADVVVDALFGTGLAREITGEAAEIVSAINKSGKSVLALDIPSGLHADTGCVLGMAVRASATITFITAKQGLYTTDGPDHTGEILFNDLKMPTAAYLAVSHTSELMDLDTERKRLPIRPHNAHKGLYGHVVIVGGDEGMSGAMQLAGRATLRTGTGLVSLATRKSHAPYLNLAQPELMCRGVEDYKELQAALKPATVVALGPGLGQSTWARDLFQTALQTELPLVVDADGLNLLAQQPARKSNWILTPHPKEAARLLNVSVSEVQNDRFAAAKALQTRFGGVIVLKGCGTLVCDDPETPVSVCPYGNPGMASGGMGDALTGLIAGLLAQGLTLSDAAQLGVCLHAGAGDKAAANAPRGLLASDVIDEIRGLVNG